MSPYGYGEYTNFYDFNLLPELMSALTLDTAVQGDKVMPEVPNNSRDIDKAVTTTAELPEPIRNSKRKIEKVVDHKLPKPKLERQERNRISAANSRNRAKENKKNLIKRIETLKKGIIDLQNAIKIAEEEQKYLLSLIENKV